MILLLVFNICILPTYLLYIPHLLNMIKQRKKLGRGVRQKDGKGRIVFGSKGLTLNQSDFLFGVACERRQNLKGVLV